MSMPPQAPGAFPDAKYDAFDDNPYRKRAATPPPPFIIGRIRRTSVYNILLGLLLMAVTPFFLLIPQGDDVRQDIVKYGVGIGGPCLGLFLLLRGVFWATNALSHPALKWPDLGAPEKVAGLIDLEMANPSKHRSVKRVIVTPDWLLHFSPLTVSCVPLSHVAWAYPRVVTRRAVYGLVAVGKTHFLQVYPTVGRGTSISGMNEAQVAQVLQLLMASAPWAIIGHQPDIEAAWKGNRQGFLEAVELRRRQVMQAAQPVGPGDAATFDIAPPSAAPPANNPW